MGRTKNGLSWKSALIIKKMWEEGESVLEISKAIGYTRAGTYYVLRKGFSNHKVLPNRRRVFIPEKACYQGAGMIPYIESEDD